MTASRKATVPRNPYRKKGITSHDNRIHHRHRARGQRIAQIVCNEPDKKMFRIRVEGRGCSGFEYRFDLVLKAEPEDAVIEHADAKILVDLLSLGYLAGPEIDYVDDLLSASFKIKNPNATAACGCGTSFSV